MFLPKAALTVVVRSSRDLRFVMLATLKVKWYDNVVFEA